LGLTSQQHAQKQSLKGRPQTPDQALQKRFGQRIQELRLKHSYSQEELSTRAGLNRTYLSDIERGQGNATLDVMNRLAVALDIGLAQLFLGVSAGPEKPVRILLAGSDATYQTVCHSLNGYDVHLSQQMKEARRLLDESEFDVVVCELEFAQGRMFDFLRLVRGSERHKNVPFITIGAVRADDPSGILHQAMQIAVGALGGSNFFEIAAASESADLGWRLKQSIELLLAGKAV